MRVTAWELAQMATLADTRLTDVVARRRTRIARSGYVPLRQHRFRWR
jgi:hypothetical protein